MRSLYRPLTSHLEAPTTTAFVPIPVEHPGGGRIQDKRDPPASELVRVKGRGGKTVLLHRLAARALEAMIASARADGIEDPFLLPVSGYRSYAEQARRWKAKLAALGGDVAATRKRVAPPGHSAHQSGRAIDLYVGIGIDVKQAKEAHGKPAFRWLEKNAVRFGFYPYDVTIEPWHWEYNPPSTGAVPPVPVSAKRDERIRWVQATLNAVLAAGLPLDGAPSPELRAALGRFQASRGIRPSGELDSSTTVALVQAGLEHLHQQSLFPQAGVLDARTRVEIEQFQRARGLDVDGVVGRETRAALVAALAATPPAAPT